MFKTQNWKFTQWIFFLSICCCPLFLFKDAHTPLKIVIYVFFALNLISAFVFKTYKKESRIKFNVLYPWIPLIVSYVILIFVHGLSGNSPFIHAVLIFILAYIGLRNFPIKRSWVYLAFSIAIIIMSLGVISDIAINGLRTEVLGVNKNRIIPELTAISAVLFVAWCFERDTFTKPLQTLIFISILLNPICVVITEVRSAFLVYLAFFPLLWLFEKKLFLKALPWLVLFISLTLVAFYSTGRLQAGFSDIASYLDGNSNSSWGIRLELWQLAIQGFPIEPIFGWGNDAFHLMINHGLTYDVPQFQAKSFHSDIFNLMATGGLVGLLGTYLTVIFLAKQSLSDYPRLTLIISSAVIGIPGLCWSSNSTSLYLISLSWLLLLLSSTSQVHKLDCATLPESD